MGIAITINSRARKYSPQKKDGPSRKGPSISTIEALEGSGIERGDGGMNELTSPAYAFCVVVVGMAFVPSFFKGEEGGMGNVGDTRPVGMEMLGKGGNN